MQKVEKIRISETVIYASDDFFFPVSFCLFFIILMKVFFPC